MEERREGNRFLYGIFRRMENEAIKEEKRIAETTCDPFVVEGIEANLQNVL